jgi:antitoxin component YwqK of YwqJK toxin-antitoxin module
MKKVRTLIILMVLVLCSSNKIQSQTYDDYKSKGETVNGLREGQWIDVNKDGAIYKKYYYKNGKPIGTWQVFGPDGRIRYESVIADEKIVNFKVFIPNSGSISIIYLTGFLEEHFQKLLTFEEQFYNEELFKESVVERGMTLVPNYRDNWKEKLYVTIKSLGIDPDVKIYYSDGTTRSEISFEKGESISQIDYYYDKNNLVKRKEYFTNGKPIKTIRYKKGVLVKEESF